MVTVQCPYCNTVMKVPFGVLTTCRNSDCKAKLVVDKSGNIQQSKPGK